jgi:hypothetical protein
MRFGLGVLDFLKKRIRSSEIVKTLIQTPLENSKLLASKRHDWGDADVPFELYIREDSCFGLFTVFLGILECRLPESEKRLLLAEFENQVLGLMESGKLDRRFYFDIQQYHDGLNEPRPSHLDRSWNVGLVFARHCGAAKQISYVAPAAATFEKCVQQRVELLNRTGRSYRILRG